MSIDLKKHQEAVRTTNADAWVMYDFRACNSIAHTTLEISQDAHCTRRWMVIVPADGAPVKIVHRMERDPLSHLRIKELVYSTYEEWNQVVREALAPYIVLAMEYSPNNSIPVVSKVDAGTIEMIRGLGHDVVSSGNISQLFTSVLSLQQIAGTEIAAGQVRDAIFAGFEFVRERLLSNVQVNEYEVQQHIVRTLDGLGLASDTPPIVAIGPNASMPHYQPTITQSSTIQRDMVVLIDCWAKHRAPASVFADLTWVGYTGSEVPRDVASTFAVITRGRDAALELVRKRFSANEPIAGFEVDDACRNVIAEAGLASNFIHRTGHNISTELHGPGVNMDNYETHDDRHILPGMSFSIEPGVYFADSLGLRTEIDVVIHHSGSVNVPSQPLQHSILPLLADEWTQ